MNCFATLLPAVACLVGCTRPNPQYCDEPSDCPVGQQCDLTKNSCAPNVDAATTVDATPDAFRPAFDVAYPHEWRFSVEGPVGGYLLVINTSSTPLNTSSLALKSIEDDHPSAVVRVTVTGYDATLSPGQAGGYVSMLSRLMLVDSGLVSESRVETDSNYLTLEIGNAPAGSYAIQAMVVLSLDNVDVPMPMTINIVEGPDVWANPLNGKRLKLSR